MTTTRAPLAISPDVMAGIAAAMVPLVQAIVCHQLDAAGHAEDWVPHTRWPWTRREAAERARAGQIPGAIRVNKQWMAKRRDLDAALATMASKGTRVAAPVSVAPVASAAPTPSTSLPTTPPHANDTRPRTADEVLAGIGYARPRGRRTR